MFSCFKSAIYFVGLSSKARVVRMSRTSRCGALRAELPGTLEQRTSETVRFLRTLRFSRPLSALTSVPRKECPACKKRRQHYCYDCLQVTSPETHPPPLHLPVQVHVIFHPGEHRGKATSLAAATISPDVHITTYPTLPELVPEETVVLYPSPSAIDIAELPEADVRRIRNIVFVDATWQQSRAIARDERVTNFKHVKLSKQFTLFWRFQELDAYHLATVEAIYYAVRAFVENRNRLGITERKTDAVHQQSEMPQEGKRSREADDEGSQKVAGSPHYHGEVDDLLFYYVHQYILIQSSYARQAQKKTLESADKTMEIKSSDEQTRVFTDRHFDQYVLEDVDWDSFLTAPSAQESK